MGTTAADSSGAGNNTTLSGGATWTTDCAGNNYALLTNGTGGIAQTSSAFTPLDVGTVAFWMRSNGNPPARQRIFGLGGDWEARQEPDGTLSFDLGEEGPPHFVTTTGLSDVGRWYHVVAFFSAADNSYSLYLDGQLHKSGINATDMVSQTAKVLSFGTRTGSAEYWQGALRDFRVYNRKLCATEIAELYGLVGHWKLDETSGLTAADSSPLGNNGTLIGGTWTGGRIDGGLQLNGTSNCVNVPHAANLSLTSQISVAAWVRTGALNDWQTVIQKGTSGGTGNYYFGTYFDEVGFSLYDGGWFDIISSGVNLQTGTWYHLAATFNNATNEVRLYVDGLEVLNTTTTASPQVNSQDLTLGTYDSSLYWNGNLDDVRVYGRVLTSVTRL